MEQSEKGRGSRRISFLWQAFPNSISGEAETLFRKCVESIAEQFDEYAEDAQSEMAESEERYTNLLMMKYWLIVRGQWNFAGYELNSSPDFSLNKYSSLSETGPEGVLSRHSGFGDN